MLEFILDFLFPIKCGVCGKIGKYICEDCLKNINKFQVENNEDSKIFFAYCYDDIIRKLLINYKFNDSSYLCKTFAECIIKNKNAYNFLIKYDIIIPVPLHWKRKMERGYNQVELIAKALVKCMNNKLEIKNNILKKITNIAPQSEQSGSSRINNVKGVYNVENGIQITGKRILIMDDIYTTGSTCSECKKMLMKYKPTEIGIFAVAKDYID